MVFVPLGTTGVSLPLDAPMSVEELAWRPGTLSHCPSGCTVTLGRSFGLPWAG